MSHPLDESPWRRAHWLLFAIVSASFFLDGVLFSLVPTLAYLLPDVAPYATYIFAANSIAFLLGALALGRAADLLGRRAGLVLSLAIYTAASIAFAAAYWLNALTVAAAFLLTSLINFGVGGETGSAFSALAEFSPARHRGKALMLAANFWNIGAAVIAGLSLIYAQLSSDPRTIVLWTFATAIALALVVLLARLHLPESPRWLAARGRAAEARRVVALFTGVEADPPPQQQGLGLKEALRTRALGFFVLLVVTSAQLTTYNIAAYYAPYAPGFPYGSDFAPIVVAVANFGASLGAFLLLPVIDKSRRASLTSAFLGGLATAAPLWLLVLKAAPAPFLAVLAVNMVFAEWAWGSLGVLESELFPTGVRASVVGVVTATAWAVNTALVAAEGYIDAPTFMAVNAAVWAAGAAAALLWHLKGFESARKTLEEIQKS
ncbi:MAG: MFS transporter [Thermoproteus sp.]